MDMKQAFAAYRLSKTGAIHIDGGPEEYDAYTDMGFPVVLITQPDPKKYKALVEHMNRRRGAISVQCYVGKHNCYRAINDHLVPQRTLDNMLVQLRLHPQLFNCLWGLERHVVEREKTFKYLDMVNGEMTRPAFVNIWQQDGGRFGNLLFTYFFARRFAKHHGLTLHTAPWCGQSFFGLDDPVLERPAPVKAEHSQDPDKVELEKTLHAPPDPENPLANICIEGEFQFDTGIYTQADKDLFETFTPIGYLAARLRARWNQLTSGKTPLCIHVRRGDYVSNYPNHPMFYATPIPVYKKWVADLWEKVSNPLLYVASDDPEMVREFAKWDAIGAGDMAIDIPNKFYVDFWCLTQAYHLAISNSSFSFAAAMLAKLNHGHYGRIPLLKIAPQFARPTKAGDMQVFDPWNAPVLLGRDEDEAYNALPTSEETCMQILNDMVLELDPQRKGAIIEVGLGTFGWAFIGMAAANFACYAIEPTPDKTLEDMCMMNHTELCVMAMSDVDGEVQFYLGAERDLGSMQPDWWGRDKKARPISVPCTRYSTFITTRNLSRVTLLKMDVEGSEAEIIGDLKTVPAENLPKIVMFEYGGCARQQKEGGWTEHYLNRTLNCLRWLRDLGYNHAYLVETKKPPREFELKRAELTADLFDADAVYGNIIAIKE
jgi:FkbM family methyltransferase